jgi:D-sedoheptulose 7-phosphate isomerase
MNYINTYFSQVETALIDLDERSVVNAVEHLAKLQGRLFIIGSGGGAGHASHAAADFRKLCNIEAYAPYDNVSELTARTNDNGWDTTLADTLAVSKLGANDALLVISVGGGTAEVSRNISTAVMYAHGCGSLIIGIVGRGGSVTEDYASVLIRIPAGENITPVTEGLQSVILHGIVTHPKLKKFQAKW